MTYSEVGFNVDVIGNVLILEVGNVEIIMFDETAELTEELNGDDLKDEDGKDVNKVENKDESEDDNGDENEEEKNDENLRGYIDGNDVKMLNNAYNLYIPINIFLYLVDIGDVFLIDDCVVMILEEE